MIYLTEHENTELKKDEVYMLWVPSQTNLQAYGTNTISWNFSGEWMCDITWDAPYMLITFRLSMTPLSIWHVLNHTFFKQYSDQVCSCLNPFRMSRVNLRRKVCSCSITKSQLIAPVPRHRLRDQAPLTPPVVDDVRSLWRTCKEQQLKHPYQPQYRRLMELQRLDET